MGRYVLLTTSGRRVSVPESAITGADLSSIGYCLACGEEHEGIEPDAEHYACEACDEPDVFGAEQLVIMGAIN